MNKETKTKVSCTKRVLSKSDDYPVCMANDDHKIYMFALKMICREHVVTKVETYKSIENIIMCLVVHDCCVLCRVVGRGGTLEKIARLRGPPR